MTARPTETELAALLDDQPALHERLTNTDPTVRRIALLEVGDQEDERLLPWLLHMLLCDEEPSVRAEAARRLAAWERDDSVRALVAALDDPDAGVAAAAAESLVELKDPACGACILPALASPRPRVRAGALRALRELRLPASLTPALELLDDAAAEVRREAVGVLGWLRPAQAVPRLARLACGDAAPEVRRAALDALGFVEGRHAEVLAALQGGLEDADWSVREQAATTLAKLRWTEALPALLRALADDYWQVSVRAARALGRLQAAAGGAWAPLADLLGHPMANVRKEAVIALGELRRPEALPALARAAEDADPDVRKLARLAIATLQAARANAEPLG